MSEQTSSFYSLKHSTPQGKEISMSQFEGRPILIVNTATQCGLAAQFKGLEAIHQKYKDEGLVVIGFPCNQFLNQEPESDDTIEAVCEMNHGVTFQLMSKSDVNGAKANEVFKYLKSKNKGLFGPRITWNFTKFLIDRNGQPVKRFAPKTKPEKMDPWIADLVKK